MKIFQSIKNSLYNPLIKVLLLMLFPLFFISILGGCTKNGMSDRDLVSISGLGESVSYLQRSNLVYLNGNGYSVDRIFVGQPIELTKSSNSADTIIVTVDPTLIAAYNSQHHENNPVFGSGVFGVAKNGVFPVLPGASQSRDSLHVTLLNGNSLRDNAVYLVPVRLSSRKGAQVRTAVQYFKVHFSIAQLYARFRGVSMLTGLSVGNLPGGAMNVIYIGDMPDSLRFRVSLNQTFPIHETDVEARLLSTTEMDSIINEQYLYGVSMPVEAYSLGRRVVKVPAASVMSTDSIGVKFKDVPSIQRGVFNFMGLKIKQYSGSAYGVAPVPNDSATVVIRVLLP